MSPDGKQSHAPFERRAAPAISVDTKKKELARAGRQPAAGRGVASPQRVSGGARRRRFNDLRRQMMGTKPSPPPESGSPRDL